MKNKVRYTVSVWSGKQFWEYPKEFKTLKTARNHAKKEWPDGNWKIRRITTETVKDFEVK